MSGHRAGVHMDNEDTIEVVAKKLQDEVNRMEREFIQNELKKFGCFRKPSFKPIPEYGDMIELEEFIDLCEQGSFVDSDGFGYYATTNGMSDKYAVPSEIKSGNIQKEWTHVCWFNK
jgi:hypothetical protein